mgnify:CR=1 FL=1|tara:strand:+ start:169 stop:459 length:291 start_codon:yes stop_codon:yes gene_type:complete
MSTIKTTVKKITDRIKNYKTHVSRPGYHGLPGMMNTGYDAAPQKGMGKSSPMKNIAGTIAKKAGQKAASKGAQKGTEAVADKHGIDSPYNYGKKKY